MSFAAYLKLLPRIRIVQLVVTDQKALRYLTEFRYDRPGTGTNLRIEGLPFGARELVTFGRTPYKMAFNVSTGPKFRYLGNTGGVFSPDDFNHFIDEGQITTATVESIQARPTSTNKTIK